MKFFAYLICYLIYPFSFLFPRYSKKWAFGSFRKSFNDNAKYLFIHCQQHYPNIDSAWITMNKEVVSTMQKKGLKVYYTLSPKGIWHALTSKFWFYNSYSSDIMYCLSGRAVCINLWHGVGLKRTEFNIQTGALAARYQEKRLKEIFFHPEVFKRPDWFLSSTPFQTKMFASAFRIPETRCLEFGYPRNEILTTREPDRQAFIDKFESADTRHLLDFIKNGLYTKVFIYMPTWRDSQREIFTQSFDLEKTNAIMKEKNALLLLKPHANTLINNKDFEHYDNIRLIDSKTDIYPILPYSDVLITDYSSILYDYILMPNKNVILYLYDYKDYIHHRDLYYPFDENIVGKMVFNFSELCQSIENNDYQIDDLQKTELVKKFWGETIYQDSCERLVEHVFHLL